MRCLYAASTFCLVTSISLLPGCRESRKGVPVGGEAATLKVTMSNIDSQDPNKARFLYEISGCIPASSGQVDKDNIVKFTAAGLKKGLAGCQIRVRSGVPISGIKPLMSNEPDLLYFAKDIIITQDAKGALEATASLQKVFVNAAAVDANAANFTLKLPVSFANEENGATVTAALTCDPALGALGVFKRSSKTEGEFSFSIAAPKDTEYNCREVQVAVDGQPNKHRGSFAANSAKFTAKAGQNGALTALKLAFVNTPQPSAPTPAGSGDDVAVNVDAQDCTGEGMIYDAATRRCITTPKP